MARMDMSNRSGMLNVRISLRSLCMCHYQMHLWIFHSQTSVAMTC